MFENFLTALPVFNEVNYVDAVLDEVLRYSKNVLVVDDGSNDGTSDVLARRQDIQLLNHEKNRGYGAALRSAFYFAQRRGYEAIVTIDCDGPHQPKRIPGFVRALDEHDADIASGSRYLKQFAGDTLPPEERRRINVEITREINERLGLHLTDAFCGFKAYRTEALKVFNITEPGYAMPLQVWVQAAQAGLKIVELPVPLIYLDLSRSFGGALDNDETRLAHYREVIERSLASAARSGCKSEENAGCR